MGTQHWWQKLSSRETKAVFSIRSIYFCSNAIYRIYLEDGYMGWIWYKIRYDNASYGFLMKMVLNMVKKSLLTIDDELSLSTNLAHAVLRLTYINALICGHNVFDDQAFVFLLDVGPFFKNLNIQIIKQTLLNCKCCVDLERKMFVFWAILTFRRAYSHHLFATESAAEDHRLPNNRTAPYGQLIRTGQPVPYWKRVLLKKKKKKELELSRLLNFDRGLVQFHDWTLY